MSTSIWQRVSADMDVGNLARARARLMSHAATMPFSAKVCEEIARISVRMGDPEEAGRWYFLVESSDEHADALVRTFIETHNGQRERVAAALPMSITGAAGRMPACAAAQLSDIPGESPNANGEKSTRSLTSRDATTGTVVGVGCLIAGLIVIVCAVVGFGTILGWITGRGR